MKNSETIKNLCNRCSNLNYKDVEKILDIAKSIELICNVEESDVFIDIPTYNKDIALVVAEAKQEETPYSYSVVGKKALRENEPGVLQTLETGIASKGIRAITQENKFVRQKVYPIENDEKTIAVLIIEEDISKEIKEDFKIDEDNLNKVNTKSHQLMNLINSNQLINNNLNDAILVFDESGILKIKNTKANMLYGNLGYGDIEGSHYDDLSLDNSTFTSYKIEISENSEEKVIRKEIKIGEIYYKLKTILINEDDLRVIEIIQDITDIKNKEAEIISKSVAIREIHHRVKNNLQTVASLLRIQSRRCSSVEAKISLNESVNRILAIAATHELLSREMRDEVKILDVINAIVDNAKRCFNNSTQKIRIKVKSEDFYLDTDRITAVSLIVNELIQNCYDHGFEDRESGNISIEISGDEITKKILVVDDGIGFKDLESVNSSLGLSIVNSYVKDKLRGTLDITSNEHGTRVEITFPMKFL